MMGIAVVPAPLAPPRNPWPAPPAACSAAGACAERIEASHPHTLAFAKPLNEMSLITPINLEVADKDGAPHTLSGFFGVDEEKVLALSGGALSKLSEAGYLAPLFMVIASQSQLSRLVKLKNG